MTTPNTTLTLELSPAELEELRIAVTIPGWENEDWQSVKRKVETLSELALVKADRVALAKAHLDVATRHREQGNIGKAAASARRAALNRRLAFDAHRKVNGKDPRP